jgi:hypothetical protein
MSVVLPGNKLWWGTSSTTWRLVRELRPFLPAELRGPWDEAERQGVARIELEGASEDDLARVKEAVLQVIEDDVRRGPEAFPSPEFFEPYMAKLRGLVDLLSGKDPVEAKPVEPSIQFHIGAAHAPDSPWGEDQIDVFMDQRFAYRNQRGPWVRRAAGSLSDDAFNRLMNAFVALPFPKVPPHNIPPGGGLVSLSVRGPGSPTEALLDYHKGLKMDGYGEVLRIFDAWATYLRQDAAKREPSDDFTEIVDEPVARAED